MRKLKVQYKSFTVNGVIIFNCLLGNISLFTPNDQLYTGQKLGQKTSSSSSKQELLTYVFDIR